MLDGHDQIILPADPVHGIQVCSGLADLVLDMLRHSRIVTPIVDNVATRTRTFLTTSPKAGDTRKVALFPPTSTVQAIRTVTGSPIPLPTPGEDTRVWLDEPRPDCLADFELLVSFTLDAARATLHAA
ncbi:hypothetical protein BOX37_28125 [Nocardia mangyaensis]|uniref:Uncharacterized protein n=1 Tax=Nocardia mangyaensis TaxID=2213200 RepID=A0A1J0VYL3_9NOCA|nr:hypothetical protein BOX37_28125 [Nocardia mangyaensis]